MKFNIPKKRVVIISASMILLLTIITVVVACLNMGRDDKKDSLDAVVTLDEDDVLLTTKPITTTEITEPTTTTQQTTTEVKIPTDEMGLVFHSTGNGSCMVVAMGSCEKTDIEIPAKSPSGLTVTAIAAGAFDGCKGIVSIKIPATVTSIGSGAFVGCSSLTSFSVEPTNTSYCVVDNVLFSKDKTEIVCYPSKRVGHTYILNSNVIKISPYAFEGVTTLKKLYYSGTISQYMGINVGTGNSVFKNMPIEFNYSLS